MLSRKKNVLLSMCFLKKDFKDQCQMLSLKSIWSYTGTIHKRNFVRISHQHTVMLSANWHESCSVRSVTTTKKTLTASVLQSSVENRHPFAFAFVSQSRQLNLTLQFYFSFPFHTVPVWILGTIEFDTFLQIWPSSLLQYHRFLMLMLQHCVV